jgi:hypothetical protein
MRRTITTAFLLFVGCLNVAVYSMAADVYDSSNFNADGRKLQPAPSGHTPGKDNGPGIGTHNSGEDCGICHTPGGKAGNYNLTIGGTIYQDRAARKPLKGAEVILQDYGGNILSMTTNETGNFWTVKPIASNPCTVANHGKDTYYLYDEVNGNCIPNVPASDSRIWLYKAWVKHGDHIRPMVSIVPVGGATGTSPRMSCNMHHSPLGSSGGVWALRKSTLASYPTTNLSFKKHILPIFRSKCAPCHIPGKTKTRLVTKTDIDPAMPTSIDYSSTRDYTSFAGSTVMSMGVTYAKTGWISDLASIYQANPDSSPLLTKTVMLPAGSAPIHGGGAFWSPTDLDYKAIRQWIAEGALNN